MTRTILNVTDNRGLADYFGKAIAELGYEAVAVGPEEVARASGSSGVEYLAAVLWLPAGNESESTQRFEDLGKVIRKEHPTTKLIGISPYAQKEPRYRLQQQKLREWSGVLPVDVKPNKHRAVHDIITD